MKYQHTCSFAVYDCKSSNLFVGAVTLTWNTFWNSKEKELFVAVLCSEWRKKAWIYNGCEDYFGYKLQAFQVLAQQIVDVGFPFKCLITNGFLNELNNK